MSDRPPPAPLDRVGVLLQWMRGPGTTWRSVAAALLLLGCRQGTTDGASSRVEASGAAVVDVGTLLTFAFDGRVLAPHGADDARESVDRQLLYTIGQLNGAGGVTSPATARISWISDEPPPRGERAEAHAGTQGPKEIRYHVELPVVWPSKVAPPSSYRFHLPLRVDAAGEVLLATTSPAACFETLSESGVWYSYRPEKAGCGFIVPMVEAIATVTPIPHASSGRYPELHRIWEDGALEVVAVFRKDVEGATGSGDLGRITFSMFVAAMKKSLGPDAVLRFSSSEAPAIPAAPSTATEATLSRTYPDGRSVQVVALLADVVAPPRGAALLGSYTRFARRFATLTPSADLVFYDGHSGLGENIRAITAQSSFVPGRYQLFYLDTCDSFAYLSDDLARRRGATTPEDPTGTRNLDVLLNGMPVTFFGMSAAAMSIISSVLPGAEPKTYDELLSGFAPGRVAFVQGCEDNVYVPSRGLPEAPIFSHRGEVDQAAALTLITPTLAAGDVVFELHADGMKGGEEGALALLLEPTGTPGSASPSTCAPSSSTSSLAPRALRCRVHLDADARVSLKVSADRRSPFVLTGFRAPAEPSAGTDVSAASRESR